MTGAWSAVFSPMTEASANPSVERFARQTLGCNCPDDVFKHIRIDSQPECFIGLPVDALIDIGGRLLVAVCAHAPWQDVQPSLQRIVTAGSACRDRNGFNRFRLVVAAEDTQEALTVLQPLFDAVIASGDDRMHLHVLPPAALPGTAFATMI
jgi:hypothetical protein